nr:MAG TPA: portal protein [Caudoviricetes sp.]
MLREVERMGLFEKLFPKKNRFPVGSTRWETLTAYKAAFTTWRGEIYEFDQVRSAIDCLARNTAKLKPEITGSAKRNLRTVLKSQPNPYQTWYQFLYRTRTIWEMQNNAIIIPILDEYDEITGIFPVLPSECEVVEYKGKEFLRYKFYGNKYAAIELDRCGIVTKHQYKSDIFGSHNTALDNTFDLLDLNRQAIKEAIKNASSFKFMGRMGNFSQDSDIAAERKRIKDANLGDKDGFLLLFSNLVEDIKQVDVKPYSIDWKQLELINNNVEKYFGVTADAIKSDLVGDKAAAFYEGSIEPFAIQLSESITKMLFTQTERNIGNAFLLTANRVQFMTNADKLNVSSSMADRGLMFIDEIREIWNLPPLPNGMGQRIPRRGEYYLLDPNNPDGDNKDE